MKLFVVFFGAMFVALLLMILLVDGPGERMAKTPKRQCLKWETRQTVRPCRIFPFAMIGTLCVAGMRTKKTRTCVEYAQ